MTGSRGFVYFLLILPNHRKRQFVLNGILLIICNCFRKFLQVANRIIQHSTDANCFCPELINVNSLRYSKPANTYSPDLLLSKKHIYPTNHTALS